MFKTVKLRFVWMMTFCVLTLHAKGQSSAGIKTKIANATKLNINNKS